MRNIFVKYFSSFIAFHFEGWWDKFGSELCSRQEMIPKEQIAVMYSYNIFKNQTYLYIERYLIDIYW